MTKTLVERLRRTGLVLTRLRSLTDDCEEALTAAASRIEELERAVSKAARMLANPDQHELTRMVDARDLLLAALSDKG